METNYPRRSFLKKMTAAGSAALVGASTGFSMNKEYSMKNIVSGIEPLGFQWAASDPFLFCVHHEDYFPQGNPNLGPDADSLKGRQYWPRTFC
ncbi:MAG: twin-arginine translocation signal domain-containing protein [Bacteroidales bacterium]|nr:twin-arginine translocation signal domain-containing protein [Bacteroidales bacterium]